MFVNTELLEFIRIKNPLSSVASEYTEVRKDCCKCPFCHSHTYAMHLFYDKMFTCFHCGKSGDVLGFVSKIESISFADAVKKLAESSGIYTLEELEQKKVFRFWDRLMLLCEFHRISADNVLKEFENKLSKEYILSLKYSKTEPDTDLLESNLCHKFSIEKEFWNADPDNIMSYLVSRKETL